MASTIGVAAFIGRAVAAATSNPTARASSVRRRAGFITTAKPQPPSTAICRCLPPCGLADKSPVSTPVRFRSHIDGGLPCRAAWHGPTIRRQAVVSKGNGWWLRSPLFGSNPAPPAFIGRECRRHGLRPHGQSAQRVAARWASSPHAGLLWDFVGCSGLDALRAAAYDPAAWPCRKSGRPMPVSPQMSPHWVFRSGVFRVRRGLKAVCFVPGAAPYKSTT